MEVTNTIMPLRTDMAITIVHTDKEVMAARTDTAVDITRLN